MSFPTHHTDCNGHPERYSAKDLAAKDKGDRKGNRQSQIHPQLNDVRPMCDRRKTKPGQLWIFQISEPSRFFVFAAKFYFAWV